MTMRLSQKPFWGGRIGLATKDGRSTRNIAIMVREKGEIARSGLKVVETTRLATI